MSDSPENPKSQHRDSALAVVTATHPEEAPHQSPEKVSDESQASQQSIVHPKLDDSPPVSFARLFQLNRSDQYFVGVTAILALGLMSAQWAQLSDWGTQPIEIEQIQAKQYNYRIDINSAD
jgi:hypothetical protein